MNLRGWHYAILMGVLGLVLLWGAACRAEIPLIQVQDVAAAANRASVRVQGTVARYPTYDPVTERLTFWVDDGTGQALVVVDQRETQALFENGQVPTIGDWVTVAGRMRVQTTVEGKSVSLKLRAPEHLEIERALPTESSIEDAAHQAAVVQYRKVLVRGQVREVWQPYGALTILRVSDQTGEIDVVYDQDLLRISGAPETVFAGDWVRVQGVVTSHEGHSQIVLDAASGLQRLPAEVVTAQEAPRSPTATLTAMTVPRPTSTAVARSTATPTDSVPARSVPMTATLVVRDDSGQTTMSLDGLDLTQTGLLSEALVGRRVTVEARIEEATLLSAGLKSVVDDGSGPAVIWMPNVLYEQLVDPGGWNVGGVARVTGRLSEYEGELELVPQSAQDVVVVTRAPRIAVADAQIGSLSVSDVGRRVIVEAKIVEVASFSAGVKCVLDDGSGRVILLLWQNVFEALPDSGALAAEQHVLVSGWVDEYRGELEIIPGLPYDVVVLGKTGSPG